MSKFNKMPNFMTQYDARDRIRSHAGNPIKQLYSGSYNERGQVELKDEVPSRPIVRHPKAEDKSPSVRCPTTPSSLRANLDACCT